MRFLMDEDADARVGEFLCSRGHNVEFSRDTLGQRTPDHLVAAAADQAGAIVVTRNYRHYRALIRRAEAGNTPRFPRAGLICFRCDDTSAVRRLQDLIGVIESEYEQVQLLPDPRLIVEITETTLQVVR